MARSAVVLLLKGCNMELFQTNGFCSGLLCGMRNSGTLLEIGEKQASTASTILNTDKYLKQPKIR